MGVGTYPFTYSSPSAFDGGRTDLRKQDGLAYSHKPEISEETYATDLNSSFLLDLIQSVNGGRTTYFESIYSPSTLTGSVGRRLHFCDTCGKGYSQPQGVSRHRRTAHKSPYSCLFSHCEFKWTRPCKYRAHLENLHRNVNPDEILGKPAGSRLRSTIIGRDLPRHLSPRATELNRRTQVGPLQCPMKPTLPEVAKSSPIPSPDMPFVACDPPPEYAYAEPAIAKRKHEEARALEFTVSANAPSPFSSTDLDISIQREQLWMPSALPGSTAANSPSNPVTQRISALAPPSSPDFADFMNEPPLPKLSYPFTISGDHEIGTNTIPPMDRHRIDIEPCGLWVEPSLEYHTLKRSGIGVP